MSRLLWLLAILCLAAASSSQEPPGFRYALTDGRMFVPEGWIPGRDLGGLLLHLHGAPSIVEDRAVRAGWRGVIINVTLPGLSSVYTERFRDPAVFPRILRQARNLLWAHGATRYADFGFVMVSSFSAGFGGVRELLAQPKSYRRIDALLMADSIYAGFAGDLARRRVDPKNMAGFLHFARDAAAGRKRMLISHSALIPPTYASTGETADYLIAQLGGRREAREEKWPGGLQWESSFRRHNVEILGFAGMTGEDHMRHLRQIDLLFRRLIPPRSELPDPWS